MKRLFLGLLLLMASLISAHADDYQFLAFETADGTVRTISIDGLEVTFSDGQLVAVAGNSQTTLILADLTKMFFTNDEANGICEVENIEAAADGLYNLKGQLVATGDRVPDVPKGVYIVKKNGKTKKVTLK